MRFTSSLMLCALPILSIACSQPGSSDEANAAATQPAGASHDVLLVGNSVDGTISFLDGRSYQNLGTLNVVPDLDQRLSDIKHNPIHAVVYALVTQKQKIKHFEP